MIKLFSFVLVFLVATCSYAQMHDSDGSEIFTPTGKNKGEKMAVEVDVDEAMPHYQQQVEAWYIKCSTPTKSDVDITTITLSDGENTVKVTAQTTSMQGDTAKKKAKQMTDNINHQSGLKGDPVDAVNSNAYIMLTGNDNWQIQKIDFTNDTGELKNEITEFKEPVLSTYKVAFHRYSGSIHGYDTSGNPSQIICGANDYVITGYLDPTSNIYTVINTLSGHMNLLGIPCWTGLDLNGGYWVIYYVDFVSLKNLLKAKVNFGITDIDLLQEVFTEEEIVITSGEIINIRDYKVMIE